MHHLLRQFFWFIRYIKDLTSLESLLKPLDPSFRKVLISMYRRERLPGLDGRKYATARFTTILPSQGMKLYELCLFLRPERTLEIGMAYGYSTLFFLAAIARNKTGHHTAVDPFQSTEWKGIGLVSTKMLAPDDGEASTFQLIEERSDRAAIDLARSNTLLDFIFIDGSHRFDDVIVDFYLYAQLCAVGGHIVFDDMWMDSVRTVVSYVLTNRKDFVEVPTTIANICVFKKIGEDTRKWNDFSRFSCS